MDTVVPPGIDVLGVAARTSAVLSGTGRPGPAR
jgi:hypothetical protein